jgi:hypothetical protein
MQPLRLTPELFDSLAAASGSGLISIFVPTHDRGRSEVAQNPIRLKNQLAAADGQLEELGRKPRERRARLAAAQEILEDREFWEHQTVGLAVFIDDEGRTTAISLSWQPEPASCVMQRFLVRHLVPELNRHRHPILILTRNAVRLYEVDGDEIELQDVNLPGSFDDVNWFVDREKQRQQHPDRVGTDSARHGHDPSAQRHADIERFVRAVAESLPVDLDGPLIVLGDDRLSELFVDEYSGECVSPRHGGLGDPDNPTEVRDVGQTPIQLVEQEREDALMARLEAQIAAGNATTSMEQALPAAFSGRLSDVVVALDAPSRWGRFDRSGFEVSISDTRRPGDVDLLDSLVVEAHRTGAHLYASRAEIDSSDFAAVFRF